MRTSIRLAQVEAHVKSAFAIADSRAALAVDPIPTPGATPAAKIAAAIRTEQIQAAAVKAADRIRDGLKSAMIEAEKAIDEVADEADTAVGVAAYIVGKSDALPDATPAHIRAAAIALRGQSNAAPIARQLVLASENAQAEVGRLRERWLPRTKHAATAAINNNAAKIFRAAGLERKAQAAELLADRAKRQRDNHIENASRRRLGVQ